MYIALTIFDGSSSFLSYCWTQVKLTDGTLKTLTLATWLGFFILKFEPIMKSWYSLNVHAGPAKKHKKQKL